MTEFWQFFLAHIAIGAIGWALGFWAGREDKK